MRTAHAGLTVFTFLVVSSASADHKVRHLRASPLRLAQIMHVQAHHLAEEIDYHYSASEWPHHQMNRISRVVESIERNVASGHWHRVPRNLHHLEHMLQALNARVKRSVVVHDHAGAGHISHSVREMTEIVEEFEHSLKHGGRRHGAHKHAKRGRVVVRPGTLHVHKGGLRFDGRLR